MMLPKLDTFVLLTNEGPTLDKKDEPWSKFMKEICPRANNKVVIYFFKTTTKIYSTFTYDYDLEMP